MLEVRREPGQLSPASSHEEPRLPGPSTSLVSSDLLVTQPQIYTCLQPSVSLPRLDSFPNLGRGPGFSPLSLSLLLFRAAAAGSSVLGARPWVLRRITVISVRGQPGRGGGAHSQMTSSLASWRQPHPQKPQAQDRVLSMYSPNPTLSSGMSTSGFLVRPSGCCLRHHPQAAGGAQVRGRGEPWV